MRLHICGCRGSTPAPGPDFVRYGGHTSCVAIAHNGGSPTLLLDAGTGLRQVWHLLNGHPFHGSILLGHLHWDHTHGLPFFRAGDDPDSQVDLFLPAQGGDPEETLARGMSPPHFPIRPRQLRGHWRFHSLEEGQHEIEGFTVLAREIPHKGGRTFGYRVSDATATIAYLSDHHPIQLGPGPTGFGEHHEAARALVHGVDLLIHDAQYTAEEFPARAHFGHSTIDYAVTLAESCDVGCLMLYHHDPPRTDDELDAIMASLRDRSVAIRAAVEGDVIDLPGDVGG
ncbi:MAG TPA: MBL fold metallo-hydrolase [Nitriliruptorales bacterium]|nr:MBL fold metallo-hydrolase [Nitriliruptorales bacterium]